MCRNAERCGGIVAPSVGSDETFRLRNQDDERGLSDPPQRRVLHRGRRARHTHRRLTRPSVPTRWRRPGSRPGAGAAPRPGSRVAPTSVPRLDSSACHTSPVAGTMYAADGGDTEGDRADHVGHGRSTTAARRAELASARRAARPTRPRRWRRGRPANRARPGATPVRRRSPRRGWCRTAFAGAPVEPQGAGELHRARPSQSRSRRRPHPEPPAGRGQTRRPPRGTAGVPPR